MTDYHRDVIRPGYEMQCWELLQAVAGPVLQIVSAHMDQESADLGQEADEEMTRKVAAHVAVQYAVELVESFRYWACEFRTPPD